MTVLLLDHLPGCSPLHPCASCLLVVHLRKKLSPAEFNYVVKYIERHTDHKASKPAGFDTSVSVEELKGALKGCGYVLNTKTKTIRPAPKKQKPPK